VTVDSVLSGSGRGGERLELCLFGEVEERLENGVLVRVLEVVVYDVDWVRGNTSQLNALFGRNERRKETHRDGNRRRSRE
jgi:hypothetical protein